jgi:cobyrinic acid a,c-diamide synthase
MKALCISSVASNSGKTTLMTALLYHFKKSVRPFKIGPDFIDPQFHESICQTASINLDSYMMTSEQVAWLFSHYSDKNISLLEGVMGFYDGMDKGCSAYDVSKQLNVPSLLLLDGSGSYITISAVLKGLKEYKKDNTIKGVIFNKLSSSMHYELIKKQIHKDFDDIEVLGWIKKDLPTLNSTHLGLDLNTLSTSKLENLSNEVLQHIEIEQLEKMASFTPIESLKYPFEEIHKVSKTLSIVYDENFSFLYHDNIKVLEALFQNVLFVDACKDEIISKNTDCVFIPGGYVETSQAYSKIENSKQFKRSLVEHAKEKPVYAECAGLLYLSNRVDDKMMSGILDIDFTLQDKRERLGYYINDKKLKGHAFHYTKPIKAFKEAESLSKTAHKAGKPSAWRKNLVYGSYLHIMFRNNISIIKEYFGI